ncbi:MAG: diacylglycerol kinase family protein [Chloroflexota bacterium]
MIKIILNPYAGRWKAKTHLERIEAIFHEANIEVDIVKTERSGQASELAREAAEAGIETVVAVGGDGTISEVMNGLVEAAGEGQAGTLGIIPVGTGNDLAAMLDLPINVEKACQKIIAGNTRIIDLGNVNGHFFDNNSAVGLEPVVTQEAAKITWLRGAMVYLAGALRGIAKRPGWMADLEWDDGAYQGPIALISVGNSPRTGGAFWMTPNAKLDDGLLDVVFTPILSRLQLLALLPLTFSGKHINHKAVTHLQVTELRIKMDPTPIQADGELIADAATEITYTVVPQKLRVIV